MRSNPIITRRVVAIGLLVAVGGVIGCPSQPAKSPEQPTPTLASVTLRVGVVNDEPLAAAIGRLRGEWGEHAGGDFELVAIDQATDSEQVDSCDVVLFASRELGALCEADQLRPVRNSVLESDEVALPDFFPLIRDVEIVYGGRVMALPIGCPCPLVFGAPSADDGYDLEGLSDRTLALSFLALAAPRAVHRSQTATLWDSDTFAPRLTQPPLVRTLAELQPPPSDGARIVWPDRSVADAAAGGAAPIPASREVYNPLSESWEQAPDRPATLLASSGRLAGVGTKTRNAATAFRFVGWLVSAPVSRQLMTASPGVANCRGSLAGTPDDWLGGDPRSPRAASFAKAIAAALRTDRYLIAPRLPGADAYLDALGAQVRAAIAGETPAAEALQKAAADWDAISADRGRAEQHAAYLRSVNLRGYEAASR